MKSPYRGVSILLAGFVVGVTCVGQAARAQAAPSDDAQALVKQGQKLNSEGKQDEALKLYKQALETSPNSYEGGWPTFRFLKGGIPRAYHCLGFMDSADAS